MSRTRILCLSKALKPSSYRSMSSSTSSKDNNKDFASILDSLMNPNPGFTPKPSRRVHPRGSTQASAASQPGQIDTAAALGRQPRSIDLLNRIEDSLEPYHLHCYTHRHNTHLTLTRPNRDPLISMSTGNLGFRKGKRGDYEAAFQLSAYFMRKMTEKGYFLDNSGVKINALEIVLRGFADGRKAFLAALMGTEGNKLRKVVTAVSDATRLKIGGTRAPNPRRLG